MWLNAPFANKTNVAIGGIIKEIKPGKILVEDDEGKVSVVLHSQEAEVSPCPHPAPGL